MFYLLPKIIHINDLIMCSAVAHNICNIRYPEIFWPIRAFKCHDIFLGTFVTKQRAGKSAFRILSTILKFVITKRMLIRIPVFPMCQYIIFIGDLPGKFFTFIIFLDS